MADNRKIRNKIRGEKGVHFSYGDEDKLAATYDQQRLDEFKQAGAIEGDWKSLISNSSGTDGFEPLSIEETLEEMMKYNFSEQVTRSMNFHGDALKEAMTARNGKSSKSGDKSTGEKATTEVAPTGDYPEGFPLLIKSRLEKLGKKYAEIKDLSREKLIELDGIADKTADDIIAFVKSQSEPTGE